MIKSLNFSNIIKFAGILLLGLLMGWIFFGGSSTEQQAMEEHVEQTHTDAQGNIVYTCSMHPNVRESEPGNCPICGMELIPAGSSSATDEENPYQLTMSSEAVKLAQIQTTEVIRDVAVKTIRMPGKVMVDERRISNVTAHFPGRIKELYVDFTGERVNKEQKLASIYSPQLLTAQRELLETSRHKDQNPSLYEATRRKLTLWELPEKQIDDIENSGKVLTEIDIVSPAEGYVLHRNISTEDHVMEGTVMYKIANLSKVWVVFNAYESDLAGLDVGDDVSFGVDAYPGETFSAQITYIDPVLDPQSRTANVRAEATNKDHRLKPQMLAEGIISSRVSNGQEQLLVPKSAVLWTGERSVLYVQKPGREQPTFEFREVVIGQRVGDQYIVKSGVKAGEQVVTNGNFKIDSAAQLSGKVSMMNREPNGGNVPGHDHGSTGNNVEMKTMRAADATKKEQGKQEHSQGGHLGILLSRYLDIKDALTNDNMKEAETHLQAFKAEVVNNTEMSNHTEHSAMLDAVETASAASNIAAFRQAFVKISATLIKAAENQNYTEETLYLQYCPMADNGEGAQWFSKEESIQNPYMGQSMPGCGEVIKEMGAGQ